MVAILKLFCILKVSISKFRIGDFFSLVDLVESISRIAVNVIRSRIQNLVEMEFGMKLF